MSVLVLALGVAFSVAVGGLMVMGLQTQREHRELAARLARDLGLAVRGTDEFFGEYRGVQVVQYSRDLGGSSSTDWWTTTRCALLTAPPRGLILANQGFFGHLADMFGAADLQIGNGLDAQLRISAEDEAGAKELLGDPEVTRWFAAILKAEGRLELKGDQLEIRLRGRHTEQARKRLDEAVAVVRALAAVSERHWQGLVERHGLRADAELTELIGVIDGVDLEIRMEGDPPRTVVRGRFHPPLADGEWLAAARRDLDIRFGDPILDGRLSVATPDAEALKARIATDAVRGPLLEVVMDHPDSRVEGDAVTLVARGRLGRRLPAAVDAVVALARGLSGGG